MPAASTRTRACRFARALAALVALGLLASSGGCDCTGDKATCASDSQCADGEVCYLDDTCVSRAVARRLGATVGEECRASGGVDFGCTDGSVCRLGFCTSPDGSVPPHMHDGGVVPPRDGDVSLPDGAATPDGGDGGVPVPTHCTIDGTPTNFPPLFGGVTEAFPDGPDAVSLAWLPAADETLPEAMTYLVFVSTMPGTFDFSMPTATVVGMTTYRATGLTTDTTYYFVVRAQDEAGQIDCNTNERAATPAMPSDCVDYPTQVQTIFTARCITCHGGATPERNLSLESYDGVMRGGLTGFEIQRCRPESSLLYSKISSDTPLVGVRMPRGGPYLSATQIDTIRRWIEQGASMACPTDVAMCSDITPPTFAGIETAAVEGATGARLCWSAAMDATSAAADIVYDVYQSTTAGGEDFTGLPSSSSAAGATCTSVTGLTPGQRYCWVVRARDAAGNRDANTVERCVDVPAAACIDFATVVQPIFTANCVRCHSGALAPRGLHLDSLAGVLAGGATGGEVVACNSGASLLVQKISLDTPPIGVRMPADGPPYLAAAQITAIRRWVDEGARASCASPDPCSDATPPTFAGLDTATPRDATRAELCWAPATDDLTPPAGITYRVYSGATPGAEDFTRATFTSAAGATCVTADALSPGGTYCFVVRAVDGAANEDANTVERCVTLPALPAGCVDYDTMIQPLFDRHCTRCHAGAAPPQWLRLDTYDNVIAGSVRRTEVNACNAATSLLLGKVSATPPLGARMPFDGPPYLSASQIAMLTQWVTSGAQRTCSEAATCGDTAAPTFGGVTSVTPVDETTLRVCWAAATDARTPAESIRYELWESTTRGGETFGDAAAVAVTGSLCVDVTVGTGTNMCFVVRARDLVGNRDGNTTELCAGTAPVACGIDYATDVQPILTARCTHCHRNDVSSPRFLDLRSYGGVIAGGAIRNEARACNWAMSLLNTKTSANVCGRRMPRDGPPWLSPAERSILQTWITSGARQRCSEPSPCGDMVAPTFGGATTITEVDPSTVEVCWAAATDDTTPTSGIRYELYDSSTPGGEDFTRAAPYAISGGATCMRIRVPSGRQTCFVARARDLAGNVDTNRAEVCRTTTAACYAYDEVVQPVLTARCAHCHSGSGAPRGIRWDTYANAISDTGEVRPCDSGSSNLIDFTQRCEMPQDTASDTGSCRACLTQTQIRLFTQWIDEGAARRDCPWGGCP